MKYYIVFSTCVLLSFSSTKSSAIGSRNNNRGSSVFGAKILSNPRTVNQAKRDISLSYAATNIDSKEGTRVKTITVIRNIGKNGKNDKISINPDLYKNEEWASAFRDNFDSYGVIPDVPDIDDLFDFVNKKKPKAKTPAVAPEYKTEAPPQQPAAKDSFDEDEKPVREISAELAEDVAVKEADPVEKIKGDAELLPGGGKKPPQNRLRSQSLSADSKLARVRAPLIDVNYSTPHHSVRQYFENYVQQNSKGYDYSKPCLHAPVSSINVKTASGHTYDIPVGNDSRINPYIAPAITKKGQVPPSQQQNNSQNFPNAPNPANQQQPQATYSVNSLLPPLQPASGVAQTQQQQPLTSPPQSQVSQQQSGGSSTSQRPYVAPNLRNSASRSSPQPAPTPIYNSSPTNFRNNAFGYGGGGGGGPNKSNAGRSRGLKY